MALTEDVEPELDQEYMDIMVAAEDQDALVVHNFELELEDFLQDVPEMHDAMVTYLEARSKLRGFLATRAIRRACDLARPAPA